MKLSPVDELAMIFVAAGFAKPEREYRFHPDRRWRADLCFVPQMLLVEYEGTVWSGRGGRHQRPLGMAGDAEKYSTASLMGFKLVRVTSTMLKDGKAAALAELAAVCLLRPNAVTGRIGPRKMPTQAETM